MTAEQLEKVRAIAQRLRALIALVEAGNRRLDRKIAQYRATPATEPIAHSDDGLYMDGPFDTTPYRGD